MPPLRLAELREFDQRRDLGLEYSKIRSAGAGVKISLLEGSVRCSKAILGFCEIDVPGHSFVLPAPPSLPRWAPRRASEEARTA